MIAIRCIRYNAGFNSVRAPQMAVCELLGIDRKIPPVTPHDKSFQV
jgi:myosin-crossreactive antigen